MREICLKVMGLTGSIATGKSFVAQIFKQKNIAVFDSDFEVASLLKTPEVIAIIKNTRELSEAVKGESIEKKLLSNLVFSSQENLKALENILHPLVESEVKKFIHNNKAARIIALEVPLLFEKNYQIYCDKVITTYCSEKTQRQRALGRGSLNSAQYDFIIKQQMPINLKALLTDYIVYTDVSDEYTKKKVEEILL